MKGFYAFMAAFSAGYLMYGFWGDWFYSIQAAVFVLSLCAFADSLSTQRQEETNRLESD